MKIARPVVKGEEGGRGSFYSDCPMAGEQIQHLDDGRRGRAPDEPAAQGLRNLMNTMTNNAERLRRSTSRNTPSRDAFPREVMAHKKNRRLALGTNATLYFEDRLTMQYQVQEMLRIERIFEADGIQDELDAYNPLIPDGSNWKATFMVEFPEIDERTQGHLTQLVGIEDRRLRAGRRLRPRIRDRRRRPRSRRREKTSAVHFLRFELPPGTGRRAARRALLSPASTTTATASRSARSPTTFASPWSPTSTSFRRPINKCDRTPYLEKYVRTILISFCGVHDAYGFVAECRRPVRFSRQSAQLAKGLNGKRYEAGHVYGHLGPITWRTR